MLLTRPGRAIFFVHDHQGGRFIGGGNRRSRNAAPLPPWAEHHRGSGLSTGIGASEGHQISAALRRSGRSGQPCRSCANSQMSTLTALFSTGTPRSHRVSDGRSAGRQFARGRSIDATPRAGPVLPILINDRLTMYRCAHLFWSVETLPMSTFVVDAI